MAVWAIGRRASSPPDGERIRKAKKGSHSRRNRARPKTPLEHKPGADQGHVEAVRALVEHGADLNAKAERGKTPLVLASDRGHAEVVAVLLNGGADPNPNPDYHTWTPLRRAARNGHTEAVRLLLEAGANPMAGDSHGETPLEIAVKYGHTDIAALMRAAAGEEVDRDFQMPVEPVQNLASLEG